MQINPSHHAAPSAPPSPAQRNAGLGGTMGFLQMMRDLKETSPSQIAGAAAPKELSAEEEMAAFKREIYEELAQINAGYSSAVLTNVVNITEDGFQRMKEDPAYRKEIMDWLRADAVASHGLPFNTHITTTITKAGATAYGVSDDLYNSDPSTRRLFEQREKGSFFRSRRKPPRTDGFEFWLRARDKNALMQKKLLEKSVEQRVEQQILDQKYFKSIELAPQTPTMWTI